MAKKNRFAGDYVDAIKLVLEGATSDEVAIKAIEKILEATPEAYSPRGRESVAIFVEAVRDLGYSFTVPAT